MAVSGKIWLVFVFFIMLLSCEEVSDISPISGNTGLIAVEAVITNENINQTIKLTLPYQQINGISLPIDDAIVRISDGTNSIELMPADSGRYITPKMRFVSGVVYTLTIEHQGKIFTAQDQSEPVEGLSPLSFRSTESGFKINFNESGSQPNYIDYRIDWTATSSCVASSSCKARTVYYDLKTVDTNELFKPSQTDLIIPPQSTIIRRKFSVSDQYRTYLRSMLSETQWRGSVFDVQRDNAPTNLSEGAIGFFAVSTVVSDTLVIK